jgi:flavin reductase (DIM6/NTAB) family NADH-FMN oxidoreductase RutF
MSHFTDHLADHLKANLRRVASTVTVLTAGDGEGAVAMTATAFTSVALEPEPTVLVCVNRTARLHDVAVRTGGFRVNVLAEGQVHTARACGGGNMARRFEAGSWEFGLWPGPRLQGALFDVACRTRELIESGTHSVFIGTVLEVNEADGAPLIYRNGDYLNVGAAGDGTGPT